VERVCIADVGEILSKEPRTIRQSYLWHGLPIRRKLRVSSTTPQAAHEASS
jgi:hypothetical protein